MLHVWGEMNSVESTTKHTNGLYGLLSSLYKVSSMQYRLTLILGLLLAENVLSQIPNVYEFCSALMTDTRNPAGRCEGQCPQGRPGKRGEEGRRGPPGPKGDRGEEGSCETLKQSMELLEATVASMIPGISPDTLANMCGLGMKSGKIPDSSITESSKWSSGWEGKRGRLDSDPNVWIARPSEIGQWIQVDFGTPSPIAGVITQGRPGTPQWMKSFKLACGNSTATWNIVSDDGSETVFAGNTDSNTKVVNFLPNVIVCRYLRLYPQSWNNHISMRMELLGGNCATLLQQNESP